MHIHWLRNHKHQFTDTVSGKEVMKATCRCGWAFLVDTRCPITLFKVRTSAGDVIYWNRNDRSEKCIGG